MYALIVHLIVYLVNINFHIFCIFIYPIYINYNNKEYLKYTLYPNYLQIRYPIISLNISLYATIFIHRIKKIHSRTISAVLHTADLVFAPTLACWKVRS